VDIVIIIIIFFKAHQHKAAGRKTRLDIIIIIVCMQSTCVLELCRETFEVQSSSTRLLILQCDSGGMHSDLIACARYNVTNEHNQTGLTDDGTEAGIVHVLLIVQLPRIAGGCFVGFQVDVLFVSQEGIFNSRVLTF